MEILSAFEHLKSTSNIETRVEEAQVEASAELVAGLREMLNNPNFSDVVFLCSDGKQVSASRMHLASRSDVLKSLLRNGMIESSLAEIKLPEVSSPAMLSVLEFLYTGTVHVYGPQSWKMGWEVIIASQFFLLPKLEIIIVRKFLHAQMVSVAYDLPGAAILLTEALSFKAIREQGHEIHMELITILSSKWSDSINFVQNFSENAFHYFLVNTSCNFEIFTDDILSFREYLRFRQVIHWWVCRSDLGSQSKEELMRILVPDKKEVMSICKRSLEVLEAVESPKEFSVRELHFNILHSDEALRRAAMRLVTNIDYRLIHPAVLAKVVEPLKISSGEILNAFRFHALRSSKALTLPVYRWKKCHSYSTSEDGHVIYKTSSTIGLAVVTEIITTEHRVYKWELVIEDDCSEFAELGFVRYCDSELDVGFDQALSSRRYAWVLKFNGKETRVSDGRPQRDTWKELQVQHWCKGSRVTFNMDTSEGTCSLSINGQDFGVVWKRLSNCENHYYPSMSFGACWRGRVRVKLGEGFMSDRNFLYLSKD